MLLFAQTSYAYLLEYLGFIIPIIGSLFGFFVFVYKKIIKKLVAAFQDHQELVESVAIIKSEVIPNGGGSLKDSVNSLKITCERIEKRQKVIEQRSKAGLHYHDQALFETDKNGNLVWINEKFYELTGKTQSDMEGYDWITYIHDEEREDFLKEFQSCMKMGRKFEFETRSSDNKRIKFVGYPYKINEKEHHGFLFNIIIIK